MNEKLKNIFDPPEKVQKMYEAISELLQERRELTSLKVQDITSRAGIGKGTAYEYFHSKEEIMIYAILWLCGREMEQLVNEMRPLQGFREKYFYLLDWLKEHKGFHDLLIKTMKGSSCESGENERCCAEPELSRQIQSFIIDRINRLMEIGYQEKIITEANVEKRVMVFCGSLMQYGLNTLGCEERPFFTMNENEIKHFIYECMVKSLNE